MTVGKYIFGNGSVGVGAGTLVDLEIPFISISKLTNQNHAIGKDILNSGEAEEDRILLIFKNKESLKVLETMVKYVKKELTKQEKLLR